MGGSNRGLAANNYLFGEYAKRNNIFFRMFAMFYYLRFCCCCLIHFFLLLHFAWPGHCGRSNGHSVRQINHFIMMLFLFSRTELTEQNDIIYLPIKACKTVAVVVAVVTGPTYSPWSNVQCKRACVAYGCGVRLNLPSFMWAINRRSTAIIFEFMAGLSVLLSELWDGDLFQAQRQRATRLRPFALRPMEHSLFCDVRDVPNNMLSSSILHALWKLVASLFQRNSLLLNWCEQ